MQHLSVTGVQYYMYNINFFVVYLELLEFVSSKITFPEPSKTFHFIKRQKKTLFIKLLLVLLKNGPVSGLFIIVESVVTKLNKHEDFFHLLFSCQIHVFCIHKKMKGETY